MKWSWKIGKFAGISVYMHATFLILIAWIVLTEWGETHSHMDPRNNPKQIGLAPQKNCQKY